MMKTNRFSYFNRKSYSLRGKKILSGMLFCVVLSCEQLFLPPVGPPEEVPHPRSRPEGVINELMRAYRLRRIDLFEDLLPRGGTFRFYVSPRFATVYSSRSNVTYEPEITKYEYVTGFNYYYWGQSEEISRHRNLFTRADKIEFIEDMNITDRKFVVNNGDTTNVEVLVTIGALSVELGFVDYRTAMERQVFYMEKDHENLWVIRDWFDLGNAP